MNRITAKFEELKKQGRKALIGYLTAGDPDLKTSAQFMRAALANGVDILEIGVPFSDPTADGPAIQAAGQRALKTGVNLRQILDMAGKLRRSFDNPFILFSYLNPLFSYGYEKICAEAARKGIDGLLVVDLPFEEAEELRGVMRRHNLTFIQLIAPTTSPQRALKLLKDADGFVYYIMVKGVTGRRSRLSSGLNAQLAKLRSLTNAPLAAGFGISNAAQARMAARHADAIVVGSALVEAARKNRLRAYVRALAKAMH
ncbi:MAG: tryptophan synthase subunit alpha [Kiritimatiellae bacterium]|nr:tryptophan synthase subunit alpha [Kiritimatiellia bacterium]